MRKLVGVVSMVLITALVIAGCSDQSQKLLKENTQLKAEVQILKQQIQSKDAKISEQEKLYELRNILDNNLRYLINSLIRGDYDWAQKNIASNVKISDKKLISSTTKGEEFEFVIPDRPMNLRQRAYIMQNGNYFTIYEISDSGYSSGKYDSRIYTLNVNYVQDSGSWKLSSIKIDE